MRYATSISKVLSTITFTLAVVGWSALAVAQTGTWATKAPMPTARLTHGVGVIDDILYAVGGLASGNYSATVEAYDPVNNTWIARASMPTPRSSLGVGVVNGKLYAVGGQLNTASLSTVEEYDPVADSWTAKASMPTARIRLAVAVVDGILYAIGGCTDFECNGFVPVVEAYDPVTNMWTTKAAMPTARRDITADAINGLIYVAGGAFGPGCSLTSVVEAYDPATNSWSSKASMPAARNTMATGAVTNILYAVGGGNCSDGDLQTAEAYDPAFNSWSMVTAMPTERAAAAAGVISGVLYVIGGSGSPNAGVVNEAFTPADTIEPVLSLPGNIVADATSPAGAVVGYSVTATDNSGVPPTVLCAPASGSNFSIGMTPVDCSATDAAGNSSNGSFTVTVNGPTAQMANLIAVVSAFNLAQGLTNSFDSKLQNAIGALDAAKGGATASACNMLDAFIYGVTAQSGKELTAEQAAMLIAGASQTKAALGCP